MTNIPKLLVHPATAVVGNKVYLIAGLDINTNKISNDILVYNFDTDVWQQNILTSISNDRARAFHYSSSAPIINGKIYLIGGSEGEFDSDLWSIKPSKKVDIYDTTTDRWHEVRDLPLPLDDHLSVVLGNKIYILGGCNSYDYYNRAKHEVISININ